MQFIIIALVWIKVYSVVVHCCPLVTNGKQSSRLWNWCCRARVCFLSYLLLRSTLSQNVNNNFKGELKTSCHLLPGGNGVYNYLNLIYSSPHLLMSWIFQKHQWSGTLGLKRLTTILPGGLWCVVSNQLTRTISLWEWRVCWDDPICPVKAVFQVLSSLFKLPELQLSGCFLDDIDKTILWG